MTRAELDALALPPREQLRAALARGAEEGAHAFARLDRSYRGFELGFRAWIAAIHAFLVERLGADVAALAVDAGTVLDAARRYALTNGPPPAGDAPAFEELVQLEPVRVLARFEALEAQRRASHDLYHDWVTALLSHVYRTRGVDELEDCLRFAGERTLLRGMERDLAQRAEQRVRRWAAMLLGNFARIHIDEDAEKFAIHQERCGSCGRQLEAGCYGAEPAFAVVAEKHPIAFNRGGVPVYRTHVAVMHYLLPIERSGVPWPVIECPAGLAPGPCRLLIYKDPARTPREHWAWLQDKSAVATR